MSRVFSNRAVKTTLATSLSAGATTINVVSTEGWPTPTGSEEAVGAINYGRAVFEIFTYTGKTATSFTGVTRGEDDTSARSWSSGTIVAHAMSAQDLSLLYESISAVDAASTELELSVNQLDTTSKLRGARAKLAVARDEPVDIVLIGDSVTHGWPGPTEASVMGTTDWPSTFEKLIAARAGNTRTPGRGWLPPRSDVLLGTYPHGWGNVARTIGETVATDGTNVASAGLGQWGRSLAVGDELVHTDDCDGITVYYTAQRSSGANIQVYIDSVLVHTINTTDGTISLSQLTDSGRSWTSDAITYGSHEVQLLVTGSGTAIIDGGYFHVGNRTTGVRVHKGGHSGAYTGTDWSGSVEHVTNVQPAVIVVFLGLNDYVYQVTAADYQTDYTALITSLAEAAPDASIVAVVPPPNLERDWDDWHAAGVAAVNATDAILIDLQEAMGDISDSADPLDLSTDGIHLSEKGGWMLAEIVADLLMPGPKDRAPVLLVDGSRIATGTLDMGSNSIDSVTDLAAESITLEENGSKLVLENTADGPAIKFYKASADANPVLQLNWTDFFSTAGMAVGPGGGTAVNTAILYSSAGVWTISGAKITGSADATAATDLMNRQSSDARYLQLAGTAPQLVNLASSGGKFYFNALINIPLFQMARTADAGVRVQVSEAGFSLGDGTGFTDVTLARASSTSFTLGGTTRITGSGAPTANTDLAHKLYVDAFTVNTQTGTSYTAVLTDQGKLITLSNASGITFTIPLNSSVAFPTGTKITLMQLGAGQVTVTPTGGVTRNAKSSHTKISGQYGVVTLVKTATDTWVMYGDTAA